MRAKLVVAVIVLAAALARAGPASAAMVTVDDDRSQCPTAEFTSIQAAVSDRRATPGTTVMVCPGHYREAVVVATPGLTVRALGAPGPAPGPCFDDSATPPDPARAVVVEAAPYAFHLSADDTGLTGFVIQGGDYGIVTSPDSSGYRIVANLVHHSGRAGINLRSSGVAETVVSHNCLRGNLRGTDSENPGILRHARIAHNRTTGNGQVGIGAPGVPGERVGVVIEHNVSRGDGLEVLAFSAAIMLSASAESRVAHNESAASARGVWVGGGNVGLEVVHNRVHDSVANGILVNARAPEPMVPNVALDVSHNDIRHSAASGLVVSFASANDSVFSRNRLTANGNDGVFFAGNRGNLVEHNRGVGNGADGIRSLPGASGNVFAGNHLRDNAEHDAHDDNRAGNQWVANHCDTDLPSGTICAPGLP
ncbi:MAG: right-handed parallel beta-helix repeat-containing protein [Nocardioidaceae bacterium]